MLNLALGLMVFLLVSQAYSQEVPTQDVTPVQPVVMSSTVEEKLEALQQQLLLLQEQMKEMNQPKAVVSEPVAAPVPTVAPMVQQPVLQPVQQPAPAVVPTAPVPVVPKKAFVSDEADFEEMERLASLRPRDHVLTWRYSYLYEKHRVTTSGLPNSTHVDGNHSELEFEYARNLSIFELGLCLSGSRNKDNDGDVRLTSDVSVVGRLNFIENRKGHNFIPYLAGYAGGLNIRTEVAGVTSKLDGGYLGAGLGFNWFPFSQIFALNLEYTFYSAGLETDSYPTTSTDTDLSGLSVGWRIYF